MSEEEILSLNGYLEDLYQAMQIGNIVFEPKHSSELYNLIDKLKKENKKYKEVINKTINYIEDNARYYSDEDEGLVFYIEEKEETFCNNLLDILKEVGHE